MLSIILTSKFEPKTIGKAVSCLIDSSYSGLQGDYELITVIPDQETIDAVKNELKRFKNATWVNLRDSNKGKPAAINKAFEAAKGEILLLTDGDVFFEKGSVKLLIDKLMSDKKYGGVSGKPITIQSKETFWGYTGNMFLAAADKKRRESSQLGKSFAMSGYIMAIRNLHLSIPDKVFDDTYISYKIINLGYKIGYEPNAIVYIKQPTNFKDWVSQKVRNIAGQSDKNLPDINKDEKRSFMVELGYIMFAITYANNLRELLWSIINYPLRLYIWLLVWKTKYISKKSALEIWDRVDSTK